MRVESRSCAGVRHDLCRLAVGAEPGRPVAALAHHAAGCRPCRERADDIALVCRWLDEQASPRDEPGPPRAGYEGVLAAQPWAAEGGGTAADGAGGGGGSGRVRGRRRGGARREGEGHSGDGAVTGGCGDAAHGEDFRERARQALARELAARLARDLLAMGQGRPPRPIAQRRRDLRRLALLAGAASLRRPPWRAVLLRLGGRRPPGPSRRELLSRAVALDPLGIDVGLAYIAQLERDGEPELANAEADRLLALVG